MALRFILGRAGTGKSRHCFDAIVYELRRDPLGPPIYWVVPQQATFQTERELTCLSGLRAFSRAKVVGFDDLGRDILAECGGVANPQVTGIGRRLVIGHLLRRHADELTFFSKSARQVGLAQQLDQTFSELEHCGKTAAELAQVAAEMEDSPSVASLSAKLRDIGLLYDRYQAYIGQERLDPHRRIEQVLERIGHCRRLRDARLYVDEFQAFTTPELRMLVGISTICHTIEITLPLDPDSAVIKSPHTIPDEMSLFFRTEQTYRRVYFAFNEAGIEPQPPLLLRKPLRFQSAALAEVEASAFGKRRQSRTQPVGLSLIDAPDRRGEVDAVARHIKSLLTSGYRLRDIAVLVRSLDDYHELIDASFREHGLPFFADRRRGATHHPLLQFTRSLIHAGLHDWPHDAAMTILKSGLAGITADESDAIENYVLLHRIRGVAWSDLRTWDYVRKTSRQQGDDDDDEHARARIDAAHIDGLRTKVVAPLRPMLKLLRSSTPVPLRQLVQTLYATYERHGIRKTLAAWIDSATTTGELEQAGEHGQVWSELMDLFDQLCDLLGDEPVSPSDFVDILEAGLESFDLALAPQTVDQILVGAVDRTRTPALRAVVVMGLSEGVFPRSTAQSSILSDQQRRDLRDRNIDINPDGERRLLDEAFLGYLAFTRAGESLCLTRPLSDGAGRELGESVFIRHVRQMFPGIVETHAPPHDCQTVDCIATPRQLVTTLLQWARTNGAKSTPPPDDGRASLYQWFASGSSLPEGIALLRTRGWSALGYRNHASLSSDVAHRLFGSPLRASVSRIETFATCPFKHFVQYGLRLQQREEDDVTAIDLGNIYHGVLEQIVREMLHSDPDWKRADIVATPKAIHRYAQKIGEDLRGELMLSTARNEYLLARVEQTLQRVVKGQSEAGRRGAFRPLKAELKFGDSPDAEMPPLTLNTPAGNTVVLRGKIDRVDRLESHSALAVVDYKLSDGKLALDHVYYGLSLQLLAYLLVLREGGKALIGRQPTPAAAFYVKLIRAIDSKKHPDEMPDPDTAEFRLKVKPRGLIARSFVSHFDASLAPGETSAVLHAKLKKDGEPGSPSDVLPDDSLNALIGHVRKRIVELSDQLIRGDVRVFPYRLNDVSPCVRCDFRSVCRFDLSTNTYHKLDSLKGAEAVAKVLAEADQ